MPLKNKIARSVYHRLPLPLRHRIRKTVESMQPHLSYSWWMRHCEAKPDAAGAAKAIAGFAFAPKISIVTPVYNTPIEILDKAIESVLRQFYENWELCVCDDLSSVAEVRERLEYWKKKDPRIKVAYSAENEGISGASNRALKLASGEFAGFLDHDDEITQDALFECVKLLQQHPQADIIYSDEDKLDPQGRRFDPNFKPDWSPEYMLNMMYVCHFSVYRKRLLDEIGGFRAEVSPGPDYDVFLRASERAREIQHIPRILYHWRMAPNSIAISPDRKPTAFEAGRKAVADHIERMGIAGEAIHGSYPGIYRLRFHVDERQKISIVVVRVGGKADGSGVPEAEHLNICLKSIKEKTAYRNREVIVADFDSGDGPRNLSRMINRAVARTSGDYVVLMHDDTEVISPDWITEMLGFCRIRGVGAVGLRLLRPGGQLQHIGIVLGLKGLAGYPLRGFLSAPLGYPDPNNFVRNYSAVSGACMMVRKEVFEKVGGFDEELPKLYGDVDFCLRLRQAGYRIVWTPEAELYQHDAPESAGPADPRESEYLKRRWGKALENDPYYNPNLTLKYEDLGYRV